MKRGRKTFSSLLILSFLSFFCITSCEQQAAPQDNPIPETINNSILETIPGYEDYEKTEITKLESKTIADGNFYTNAEKQIANSFLNQTESLISLKVFSDDYTVINHEGNSGISVAGTTVGFVFLQDVNKSFEYADKTIEIINANTRTAGEYTFTGNFRNGAFLVYKSFDQENWQSVASAIETNRYTIAFLPDANDVFQGVYYRFVSIMQFRFLSHYETRTSGWIFKKTWEEPVYAVFNVIQQYKVAVARNSVSIRFTCESIESTPISGEDLAEEAIGVLQSSTTMTDGSTSTSYIKAELQNPSSTINYSYLGKDTTSEGTITSDTTFTDPGKYVFNTKTFFGDEESTTLYLVNLGDDNGKKTFFGDGVLNADMRMYDPTKAVQTYMVGKQYQLIELPDYVPARYGAIYYFKNDSDLTNGIGENVKQFDGSRDLESNVFTTQGYYVFDFYNCDPSISSGDILHYRFTYYCSNDTTYAPFVNYSLITNPARSMLLSTKVLAVSMPTAGGGSYQFVYPYTEEYLDNAYNMAVEIEELNVEIIENNGAKYYYYKSMDNPYIKTNYVNKVALYESINKYAKQNMNLIYLESDIPFANKVVDEELKNLNESSISQTIRVVENKQVLTDLRTNEIYLNNYKFTQVADFEVDSITAVGENNNPYDIEFDQEIDSLFTHSERITITEHNWNGNKTYQAIYSKNNTCELIVYNGFMNQKIDLLDNNETFDLASFKFVMASDKYDSQTLIAINDGNTRSLFTMNEIAGLSLPAGHFEITVINRNSQTYRFVVDCEGIISSNEQLISRYNHNPLQSNIDDLQTPVDEEPIPTANDSVSLLIWVFVLILVGALIVGGIIGLIAGVIVAKVS